MSHDREWWLRKFVTDGLDNGMFERTTVANGQLSPWGADPVLVTKPGKAEPRLTFNYHYVTEETPAAQMELASTVHEFLSAPSHQTFCHFDLKNAYWVVQIHPADRYFLAFSVPGIGQVQPTRMAQGARSSSFTMNELLNIALGPIPPPLAEPSLTEPQLVGTLPNTKFYIDDIYAAHSDWEGQFTFLRDHLFPRLLWAKFRLSFSKLILGADQIVGLGEVHKAGGAIEIKPERVRLILEWPVPTDAHTVRSFLGTTGTTRQWVKNYAETARPLSRLTGTKIEFQWGPTEQLAFDLLRNLCATAGARHGWIPGVPVELFSDASQFAAGCFIGQRVGGVLYPIFYDSFLFTATERRYGTYKRELRAIVAFTKKFRHLLQTHEPSIVWTDHKPLVSFQNGDNHEEIYWRWAQKLSLVNIKIQYIAGERNKAADGLSRTIFNQECSQTDAVDKLASRVEENPVEKNEWFWKDGKGGYEQLLKSLTNEEIGVLEHSMYLSKEEDSSVKPHIDTATLSKDDDVVLTCLSTSTRNNAQGDQYEEIRLMWYGDLETYLKTQGVPTHWKPSKKGHFKRLAWDFRLDEDTGKLMKKHGEEWVRCIGPDEVYDLLQVVHDKSGHFQAGIVLEKLQNRVWWPTLQKDVIDYCKSCIECIKVSAARRVSPLVPIHALRPFQMMAMDTIGPLATSKKGSRYILTVVDYFSRFLCTEAIPSQDDSTIREAISRVFDRTTIPYVVYADRASYFMSAHVKGFMADQGVHLEPVPGKSHRSAGLVEITNKILRYRLLTGRFSHHEEMQEDRDEILDDTWDERLGEATRHFNHHHIASLGYCPAEIALGTTPNELMTFEMTFPSPERTEVMKIVSLPHESHADENHFLSSIQSFMATRHRRNRLTAIADADTKEQRKLSFEKYKGTRPIEVGDMVVVLAELPQKLQVRWRGPFRVRSPGREAGLSWFIENLDGRLIGSRHADTLKVIPERKGYLAREPKKESFYPLRYAARNPQTNPLVNTRLEPTEQAMEVTQKMYSVPQGPSATKSQSQTDRIGKSLRQPPPNDRETDTSVFKDSPQPTILSPSSTPETPSSNQQKGEQPGQSSQQVAKPKRTTLTKDRQNLLQRAREKKANKKQSSQITLVHCNKLTTMGSRRKHLDDEKKGMHTKRLARQRKLTARKRLDPAWFARQEETREARLAKAREKRAENALNPIWREKNRGWKRKWAQRPENKAKAKAYYNVPANKKRILAMSKEYRSRNVEKIRARKHAYYERNKHIWKARNKLRQQAKSRATQARFKQSKLQRNEYKRKKANEHYWRHHDEHVLRCRKWRQDHLEQRRAAEREYGRRNKEQKRKAASERYHSLRSVANLSDHESDSEGTIALKQASRETLKAMNTAKLKRGRARTAARQEKERECNELIKIEITEDMPEDERVKIQEAHVWLKELRATRDVHNEKNRVNREKLKARRAEEAKRAERETGETELNLDKAKKTKARARIKKTMDKTQDVETDTEESDAEMIEERQYMTRARAKAIKAAGKASKTTV